MSESYVVAARLEMFSNVSATMESMARSLRDDNRIIAEAQEAVGKLGESLKDLGRGGTSGLGRMVEQMLGTI